MCVTFFLPQTLQMGKNLHMGNDFYNQNGFENEGLLSGRNSQVQNTLWHPVIYAVLNDAVKKIYFKQNKLFHKEKITPHFLIS